MSATKYRHGEWVCLHTDGGCYTGHIRKRKGRWWFFGDVCKDIKGLLSNITIHGRIQRLNA